MSNPVVHFEVGCPDTGQAAQFYSSLFGWTGTPMGPATLIDTGSKAGIQGHFTTLGHEPHHYTIFYVQVDDIDLYLSKAAALGGKTLVPKVDIPTGSFAWISDPAGNTVGLWKPSQA
jgi:predicted enzyme related to lactoylglutathione lyase